MYLRNIKHIDDVKTFTKLLLLEGINVHPDEDFKNYINIYTGEASYSIADAEMRNDLMEQSFNVCAFFGKDIYDLMQEIYLIETGLDQYIPLP